VTFVLLVADLPEVSGDTPQARAASVDRIVARRPLGARWALLRAANDKSAEVRRKVMVGLIRFLSPEVRPIVEKGIADEDPSVRRAAVGTLSLYRDSPAAIALEKVFETDLDRSVRLAALRCLAKCDDPRAIVLPLQVAENSQNTEEKQLAMKMLLHKFGAHLPKEHDPQDPQTWPSLIQNVKRMEVIQKAFAALSVRLIQRPEDIAGTRTHDRALAPNTPTGP
jgi:HEAT repeat protein